MAALLDAAYTYTATEGPVDTLELEIRDDVAAAVLRVDSSDPRLTVTHDDGANTVLFALVLSGGDAEVVAAGLPLTVNGSVLYTPAGVAVSPVEAFTDFTLGDAADEVTVRHTVQWPAA